MVEYINSKKVFLDKSSALLSVIEFNSLPWLPARIYWLQDFKNGAERGNHAHKKLSQIFVMMNGNVTIEIFQGLESKKITLDQESDPILLLPGTWRTISDASLNAILMVFADSPYDENDYIRDWKTYQEWYIKEFRS